MGATLSVTTGFGFAVPVEVVERWNERSEWEGFSELMWDLCCNEFLLEYNYAHWYDDILDGNHAVFVKSTIKTEYGAGVFRVEAPKRPDADGLNALFRIQKALGIESELQALEYLTVVSIG